MLFLSGILIIIKTFRSKRSPVWAFLWENWFGYTISHLPSHWSGMHLQHKVRITCNWESQTFLNFIFKVNQVGSLGCDSNEEQFYQGMMHSLLILQYIAGLVKRKLAELLCSSCGEWAFCVFLHEPFRCCVHKNIQPRYVTDFYYYYFFFWSLGSYFVAFFVFLLKPRKLVCCIFRNSQSSVRE